MPSAWPNGFHRQGGLATIRKSIQKAHWVGEQFPITRTEHVARAIARALEAERLEEVKARARRRRPQRDDVARANAAIVDPNEIRNALIRPGPDAGAKLGTYPADNGRWPISPATFDGRDERGPFVVRTLTVGEIANLIDRGIEMELIPDGRAKIWVEDGVPA